MAATVAQEELEEGGDLPGLHDHELKGFVDHYNKTPSKLN